MGISETILAAGIGGVATIMAGLVQLYSALRVKTKADTRPKRTKMVRSMISIAALMATSAAGGYFFAEYRQQRTLDDLRSMHEELRGMRNELNARLQAISRTERPAQKHGVVGSPADVEASPALPELAVAAPPAPAKTSR